MDQLISVKESAHRLGCTEAAIRKWLHQRKIERVKLGRLTRIRQADLEAIIRVGLQSGQSEKAA
jgi:excisionase family DNA binding protein